MTMEEAALDAVPGISLLEVLLDLIQMAPTVREMCKAREALQTDRFYHPTRRNLFPAVKEKKEPSPIGRIRFHIRLPLVVQSPSSSQSQRLASSLSSNYGSFTVVPSTLTPRAVILRVRFLTFIPPWFLVFLTLFLIFILLGLTDLCLGLNDKNYNVLADIMMDLRYQKINIL